MDEVEKRHIAKALGFYRWDRSQTATQLGNQSKNIIYKNKEVSDYTLKMLDNLITKYIAGEFLNNEESPSAILDPQLRFIWFNKKFKEKTGIRLSKGKYFPDLFSGISEKDFKSLKQGKILQF
jgi:hypothetical protein